MFKQLIESEATAQRRTGGTVISFVAHTLLIFGAVQATISSGHAREKVKPTSVTFVPVKPAEPPPPKPEVRQQEVVNTPPQVKGFQTLIAPIDIPNTLPPIDLTREATRAEDWSGIGKPGGIANGVVDGVARPLNSDAVLLDFQVERPVAAAPNQPSPQYPNQLRAANIEGQVIARFVVDTLGRADMKTFEIIKSDHDLFTNAVRTSLPIMKFFPAEAAGKKVKQLVQMPFVFSLTK